MAEKLTKEELKEIQEAFSIFDTDGNGFITIKELGRFMESMSLKPTEQELVEMINEVDLDGNKSIDFCEFVNLMLKDIDFEGELKEAFNVFDQEGHGFITVEQLKQVMMNLGEKFTEDEAAEMVLAADKDGNGLVNVNELSKLMMAEVTVPRKASTVGPKGTKINVVDPEEPLQCSDSED